MRPRHITAALAVAALYALLLQGFLGALAPGRFAVAGTHCAPAADGVPGGHDPAAHDGACCLVGCRPLLAAPPSAAVPAARVAIAADPSLPETASAAGPRLAADLRARGPPAA
jgi:hypothetical protein